MNIYLYWPFAREEDTEIFAAIPGPEDRVTLHMIDRPGAPVDGSERLILRKDLPEVPAGLAPPSLKWLMSRYRTYRDRARTRRKVVTSGNVDIVHLGFLNRFTDLITVRRLSGTVPLLVTIHDVVPHNTRLPEWAQTPLLTAIYKSCGSILVHHEDVKAELVSTFPVDPARVSVVPLWATPHWTSDEPRTLGAPPVVLFQGSLRKNKGVDVLLDAIGRLADSDLRFVIAGRGDAGVEERVRAAAAANDRLTAEIGWVTPERKQELLVGCDLVVMPYTSFASQSAVLHDAYGAHVPVVGTEVGALGASIRADGTGRSVEPSDAVGLAEAISGLLGDPEEWARCSAASRRMGIERSPEAFGRGLRGVYTETIAAFGK